MNVEQIKQVLIGDWISIALEVRPSANKNPDGTLAPARAPRGAKHVVSTSEKSPRLKRCANYEE